MLIKKIITMILLISVLLSTSVFRITFAVDNKTMLNELSNEEYLSTKGYLLQIEDGNYGDIEISNDIKFNKDKIWGTLIDENDQKLQLRGYIENFSPLTLKYIGEIYDKSNYKFEAYINRDDVTNLANSLYKGTINVIEYNDKEEQINAKTYIIENIISSKYMYSEVTSEIEKHSSTLSNIVSRNDGDYYVYQDSISGTGYGVQIFYPTGSSQNQNHRFRVQTKQADAMKWFRNEYPSYEPVYAYGRNVDFYHDSYSGTVMNNVSPTKSEKSFSISIGYGWFSVEIPVTFSSVSIDNDGSKNLSYTTSTTNNWVDNYPNQDPPDSKGKMFTSDWKVPNNVSPGNNKIKVSIQYITVGEDSFGLRMSAFPVFSSSFTAYDSNN